MASSLTPAHEPRQEISNCHELLEISNCHELFRNCHELFPVHAHNIRADDFERFVADLLRRLPHGLILVMDRWQVHRSAARRLMERFARRLRIEWLPAYAPDLNPDEQVWRHTKHADLANYVPEIAPPPPLIRAGGATGWCGVAAITATVVPSQTQHMLKS